MRPMFDHYDHHDWPGNALTLRAILEREPQTWRAYFDELASEPLNTKSRKISSS